MPTHELSLAELLRSGYDAFRKNLKSVVLFFTGAQALVFLITYLLNAPFLNILMIPVVIFMQIALLKSFKHPIEKLETDKVLDLKDPGLKNKIIRLVISYVIYIILLILLFLLLIVPGIIFMVYWYFFSYIVLDQHLSGMAALKKSKEMIKGHFWKTFALLVIGALTGILISSVVTSIGGSNAFAGGLLMSVTSGIISIYFGYVAVAYYFDLKR